MRGRRASEGACRAALESLGVSADRPPGHLNDGERVLRRGLRAKARQLGDTNGSIELLVGGVRVRAVASVVVRGGSLRRTGF